MRHTSIVFLASLLLAAACAQAPEPPASVRQGPLIMGKDGQFFSPDGAPSGLYREPYTGGGAVDSGPYSGGGKLYELTPAR